MDNDVREDEYIHFLNRNQFLLRIYPQVLVDKLAYASNLPKKFYSYIGDLSEFLTLSMYKVSDFDFSSNINLEKRDITVSFLHYEDGVSLIDIFNNWDTYYKDDCYFELVLLNRKGEEFKKFKLNNIKLTKFWLSDLKYSKGLLLIKAKFEYI